MRDRPEVHEIFRRWQEVAGEYIPKPTLMGETYVPLERLPAYYAHLDLAQNFPFLKADFDLDELRPIVETTMAELPKGREPVWFGSNHDHSRMATRWAGGDERKHEAALFLILTLPGSAILYQGDELGLEDGASRRSHPRCGRPAARPRAHAVSVDAQRRRMAEPVAPARPTRRATPRTARSSRTRVT